MFEVTVEAEFASAHYLRNYQGKCEHPHGHNYKAHVTLIGQELDEAGMLLDFTLLKRALRPVADWLDHKMLNELEPFTAINPSAENLAKYIYEQVGSQVVEMSQGRARVKSCTVWETDRAFATYYE